MKRLLVAALLLPLVAAPAFAHKNPERNPAAPRTGKTMSRPSRGVPTSKTTSGSGINQSRPPSRVWRVPHDHATLQAAIDGAAPFDTIDVDPGRYGESLVLSHRQRGLVLRAVAGPEVTRLVGGGDARLITFDEVDTLITVTGFTLEGGRPQFDGGAVYAYRSNLALINCVFRGNETPGDGGAVALYESSARLSDCRLEANAARRGGGLFVGSSRVGLERNVIRGNTAELEGGGIYCTDGSGAEPGKSQVDGNRPDDMAGCAPAPPPPPEPRR